MLPSLSFIPYPSVLIILHSSPPLVVVHSSSFTLRALGSCIFWPHSTFPFNARVGLFQHKHCYSSSCVIMIFSVRNSVWWSCFKTRFSSQTEEFKDCPPGFLYILALSMVIEEVQADNELLSTRQYREGKFTIVVGIFVSLNRFTCFETGSDLA